jgi:hypothetical protein
MDHEQESYIVVGLKIAEQLLQWRLDHAEANYFKKFPDSRTTKMTRLEMQTALGQIRDYAKNPEWRKTILNTMIINNLKS